MSDSAKDLRNSLTRGQEDEPAGSPVIPIRMDSLLNEFDNGKEVGERAGVEGKMAEKYTWKRTFLQCWTGWPNDGKSENIHNLIPTTVGFVKMADIKPGHYVFDTNGKPTKVLRVTKVIFGRKCYRVGFSDGTKIDVCEDHEWLTYDNSALRSFYKQSRRTQTKERGYDQRDKCSQPSVVTTKEISKTLWDKKRNRVNHHVMLAKAISCTRKKLKIRPYVLGIWLGDGTRNTSQITTSDYEIVKNIKNYGYDVTKNSHKYRYNIKLLISNLKNYDIHDVKRIPINYLFSSSSQRLELLCGLMDSDGHINKNGICEFTNTSKSLAEDVYSLICSLGIKCGWSEGVAKYSDKITGTKYRLSFKTNKLVFKLQRKKERIPVHISPRQKFRSIISCEEIDSFPTKCIEVEADNHLYLTSRSFIPTHNTTFFMFMSLLKALIDDWHFCIWPPEMFSSEKVDGKIIRNPNDIVDELIYMLAGQTPYKHYYELYRLKQMDRKRYIECAHIIKKHFTIVHPKEKTFEGVIESFKRVYDDRKGKVDAFLVDPFKNIRQSGYGRTDLMLDEAFDTFKDFALDTNSSMNFIAHPGKQNEVKDKDGAYKVVDQHMLLGGSAWDNGMDAIYSVYRPFRHESVNDPRVNFYSLKKRKQQLTGKRGMVDEIEFNIKTNRFYFNDICPIDQEKNPARVTKDDLQPQVSMDFSNELHSDDQDAPF